MAAFSEELIIAACSFLPNLQRWNKQAGRYLVQQSTGVYLTGV